MRSLENEVGKGCWLMGTADRADRRGILARAPTPSMDLRHDFPNNRRNRLPLGFSGATSGASAAARRAR